MREKHVLLLLLLLIPLVKTSTLTSSSSAASTDAATKGGLQFLELDHEPRVYVAAPSGVQVMKLVALDRENPDSNILYRLQEEVSHEGDSEYFQIDEVKGTISTRRYVDRSVGELYIFIVVASSLSLREYKRINVRVTEYNRFPPVFVVSSYIVDLDVLTPIGKPFLTVKAIDKDVQPYNSEVYYSIQTNNRVAVNHTSGEVFLKSRLTTTVRKLSATVYAHDGGSPRRDRTAKIFIYVKLISAPQELAVEQIGDRWAMLCWKNPQSAQIEGYVVYITTTTNLENNTTKSTTTSRNMSSGELGERGNKICTAISNLETWSSIYIYVSGWNKMEVGMKSQPISFHTRVNRTCTTMSKREYTCTCLPGFYGTECELFNPCLGAESPCRNEGICKSNASNIFHCECQEGYYGLNCENFNPCSLSPCQHGSKCYNTTNFNFTCNCASGYTGRHCEININDCHSSPCLNGGSCVDGHISFSCNCPVGVKGKYCEINPDECSSSPCQNGGTCHDGLGKFTCHCLPGFKGVWCETNVDECFSNPCDNNGTCVDGNNIFTCNCEAGFEGDYCEEEVDECMYRPCINGGSCQDSFNDFVCVCPIGYSGKRCEIDIDLCSSNPCRSGASCHDVGDQYHCNCTQGYYGRDCELKVHCPNETVKTDRGTFHWTSVEHGSFSRIECPYGAQDNYTSTILETSHSHSNKRDLLEWTSTFQYAYHKVSNDPTRLHAQQKDAEYRNALGITNSRGILNNIQRFDKDMTAYAVRSCIQMRDGSVKWGNVMDNICRHEGYTLAEKLIKRLEDQTRDPSRIDVQMFINASIDIHGVFHYALIDRKIAQSMISVISNMMDVNDSVIEEGDKNGTISQSLVQIVDSYTGAVKLTESKNISITSLNLALQAIDIDCEEMNNTQVISYWPTHLTRENNNSLGNHENNDGLAHLEDTLDISINIPLPTERYSSSIRVQFVSYKNSKFFRPASLNKDLNYDEIDKNPYSMTQQVISATITNTSVENLTEPLMYKLPNMYGNARQICVYWEPKIQEWLEDGLTTNQSEEVILCESTHLTAFSVLLDPDPGAYTSDKNKKILSIISYIGSICSIVGLLLTILTYSLFRCLNRDRSGRILLNLCVSLLLMNASFLLVAIKDHVFLVNLCMGVAILTHYFVLTSLSWMLVEAVNMYHLLVMVFATSETKFMLKRTVCAWGLPLIIVITTAVYNIDYYRSVNSEYCLISSSDPYVYYIAYLGPCCLILAVNFIVFVLVSRVLFQKRATGKVGAHTESGITVAQVRGAFTVMTLLGVTWVFGAFAIGEAKLIFQYSFCIANSLQGFIIFLVRCVQYPEAQMAWMTLLRTGKLKKHRGAIPSSSINNSQSRHTVSSSSYSQCIHKTSVDTSIGSNNGNHMSIWSRFCTRDGQINPRSQTYSDWSFRSAFGSSKSTKNCTKNCENIHETNTREIEDKHDPMPISAPLKSELKKSLTRRTSTLQPQNIQTNGCNTFDETSHLKWGGKIQDSSQIDSKTIILHSNKDSEEFLSSKDRKNTPLELMNSPSDVIADGNISETGLNSMESHKNVSEDTFCIHMEETAKLKNCPKTVNHSDQGYMSGACTAEHTPESPTQNNKQISNLHKPFSDARLVVSTPEQLYRDAKGANPRITDDKNNIGILRRSESDTVPKIYTQECENEDKLLQTYTFVVVNGHKIYTNNPSVRLNLEQTFGSNLTQIDVQCMKNNKVNKE